MFKQTEAGDDCVNLARTMSKFESTRRALFEHDTKLDLLKFNAFQK